MRTPLLKSRVSRIRCLQSIYRTLQDNERRRTCRPTVNANTWLQVPLYYCDTWWSNIVCRIQDQPKWFVTDCRFSTFQSSEFNFSPSHIWSNAKVRKFMAPVWQEEEYQSDILWAGSHNRAYEESIPVILKGHQWTCRSSWKWVVGFLTLFLINDAFYLPRPAGLSCVSGNDQVRLGATKIHWYAGIDETGRQVWGR